MSSPTVIVIDDDIQLLEILHRILVKNGYRVLAYSQPKSFIEDIKADPFYREEVSAYLIDVMMPEIDGLALQNLIYEYNISSQIILMSANASVESVNNAWRNGALDFLIKPFETSQLLSTIEKATSEHQKILQSNQKSNDGVDLDRFKKLSPREIEVLVEIASGATTRESASRMGISERTVKLHRKNLRQRLGILSIPDLVRYYDLIKDQL